MKPGAIAMPEISRRLCTLVLVFFALTLAGCATTPASGGPETPAPRASTDPASRGPEIPAPQAPTGDGYGYPIPDPYAATILGTPDALKPDLPAEIPRKRIVLEVVPGVTKPDVFFYDKGLRFSIALQKVKAPLVFIIPGTGANEMAPRVITMMKLFYKLGYHVIALPNPTNANFVISGSRSHVPGDLLEDSEDVYAAMETVWRKVKDDIEVSAFHVVGYSLGGTLAAFVSKLDEERKVFNFGRVVMINPAVSLYTSISRIEALLDRIPGGPTKIGAFFNQELAKFTEIYREGDFVDVNDQFFFAIYKSGELTDDVAGGLIGLAFRVNSAGMIFASDVMTNSGYIVPKNRVLVFEDPLDDYFRVGVHISFLQYFDEYFLPYFQQKRPGLTREALIEIESLRSIEGYLKASPKITVMTNGDDLILSRADFDYLRQIFGERLKEYPRGGHLGNLEYRDNMNYLGDSVGMFK